MRWFVYIGKKIPGLRRNLHTRLAIVTANKLGLAFPPRNLPKELRPDPSTFYLVIVVTSRQPDRQTNAGDYIIPRKSFRGDNIIIIIIIIIKGIYIAQVRNGHKYALSAEMAVWLRNCLYLYSYLSHN